MPSPSGAYNLIRSVSTSTAITIEQVTAPAGTMIEIARTWVNQSTSTTSAQTRILLLRKSTPATVTSTNPAPLGNGMQASKCVGGTGATGITATVEGTDSTVYIDEGFNVVNGHLYLPVPEERLYAINDTRALKFGAAPASATYSSGIEWLEYAA